MLTMLPAPFEDSIVRKRLLGGSDRRTFVW
jgi:hypothetical protein